MKQLITKLLSSLALTKHLIRILKHLTIYLTISLPLQIIGIVALAIVVPFMNNSTVRLPYLLRWFDLADNYPEYNRTNITYVNKILPQGKWARYNYLALRNPTNYFAYKYLSIKRPALSTVFNYSYHQEPDKAWKNKYERKEIGDTTAAGKMYAELREGNGDEDGKVLAYEYYVVWKYREDKCVRIRIGYKLGGLPGQYVQEVFVISPFHSYTGV
jgi:hypothetical protein